MFYENVRDNQPALRLEKREDVPRAAGKGKATVRIKAKRIEQKVAKNAKTIWIH